MRERLYTPDPYTARIEFALAGPSIACQHDEITAPVGAAA
jgi:hypothetical protein